MPNFLNTLPVAVDAVWANVDANGNVVPVTPDSVDWTVDVGTIAPDVSNPTGRAIVNGTPGVTGDFTVGAMSHQVGQADFTAPPLVGTWINPPPPQINSATLSFEPQTGAAGSMARGVRRR